ncbi:polyprenyl diphosphate synthase [Streptomyces rimosus]|uniref:polyprenyl diphosphate synthase n=1 Tax=Streptomyces rimosus TaxID=1927 RepID=UPI0007C53710|nr:polyprenyl diphosphate synthase [Streptomyces rimosus]
MPRHVAIVMDGNGRWATARGRPRHEGHEAGAAALQDVVHGALEAGFPYLTLYAFSTENWGRPKEELQHLLDIFHGMYADASSMDEEQSLGVRMRWAGRRTRLPNSLGRALCRAEAKTRHGTALTLTLCLDYGGRLEITEAAAALARDVGSGRIGVSDIDEALFSRYLSVPELPDVDLLIRTGGQLRTSNFLPWQSTYAELYFTDTLWPDMDRRDLWQALITYTGRKRTHGRVTAAPSRTASRIAAEKPTVSYSVEQHHRGLSLADQWALVRAGITDPTLRAAYGHCRHLVADRVGSLLDWGTWAVPARRRPYLWALVAALAEADDLVDSSAGLEERMADFDAYSRMMCGVLSGTESPEHPVARAWLHTVRACGIDTDVYLTCLRGLRDDFTVTSYATYADLRCYINAVAMTSFSMFLPALGMSSAQAEEQVPVLSEAQQLTNIIRDVGADARQLGRIYLPREDLDRFAVEPGDLYRPRATDAVRELIRFECERAHALWEEGARHIDELPFRYRAIWTAGIAFSREILRMIARHDYDVLAAGRQGFLPVWPSGTAKDPRAAPTASDGGEQPPGPLSRNDT